MGIRAILQKYNLTYEDRDIINDAAQYEEMVRKSGQPLSPCVEVDGQMAADISGDELEMWMFKKGYISPNNAATAVPTNAPCATEMQPNVSFSPQRK